MCNLRLRKLFIVDDIDAFINGALVTREVDLQDKTSDRQTSDVKWSSILNTSRIFHLYRSVGHSRFFDES